MSKNSLKQKTRQTAKQMPTFAKLGMIATVFAISSYAFAPGSPAGIAVGVTGIPFLAAAVFVGFNDYILFLEKKDNGD